jgi:uncharacterized protein with GYD domain
MTQFAYTAEAWAALTRDPQDRSEAVRALLGGMGSRLVSFYYSFGEYDGAIIFESPAAQRRGRDGGDAQGR